MHARGKLYLKPKMQLIIVQNSAREAESISPLPYLALNVLSSDLRRFPPQINPVPKQCGERDGSQQEYIVRAHLIAYGSSVDPEKSEPVERSPQKPSNNHQFWFPVGKHAAIVRVSPSPSRQSCMKGMIFITNESRIRDAPIPSVKLFLRRPKAAPCLSSWMQTR